MTNEIINKTDSEITNIYQSPSSDIEVYEENFNRNDYIKKSTVLTTFLAVAGILIFARVLLFINGQNKKEPEFKEPVVKEVVVQTQQVAPTSHSPIINSTAAVQAWQESQLAAQVGGRLEWLCDCLETGTQVKKGTVLAKIEAVDYLVNVAQAKQAMADAKQRIAEEQARSDQAKNDWVELNLGQPTDLALRKPQLEAANATLQRRKLELQQAQRNLARTQIKAPYDGIITARTANVGNVIGMGTGIGTILNTDKVQIRFALSPADMNKLDSENGKIDILQSNNPSKKWQAEITRIDSVIDPKTRLVNVIAEVNQPFDTSVHTDQLRVGTFVSTAINGKAMNNLYALPSSAVLSDNSVYTVDADNKIMIYQAQVVHRNPNDVLVRIPDAGSASLSIIDQGQIALSSGLLVNPTAKSDL